MYEVVSRLIVKKGWKVDESMDEDNCSVFQIGFTDEDNVTTVLIITVDHKDALLKVLALKRIDYINERNQSSIKSRLDSISFNEHFPVSFSIIKDVHFVTKYLLEGEYIILTENIFEGIIDKVMAFSHEIKEHLDDSFNKNNSFQKDRISA